MAKAGSRETMVADNLTERQKECLKHTAEGMSSKQIGRMLGLSPSTVDNHIHTAVAKLHAKNRHEAAELIHPDRTNSELDGPRRRWVLPPLGGTRNPTSPRSRLIQVISIATISLLIVSAVSSSVLAVVYLLSTM